ncbi:hypothetical protein NEDG_00362 [Nematocida displodere]|uniref:Uncharacterized protein n=1 Tax=Nematocida displodere TaxID=1805483 RepID=A0A177EIX6_9MICR|nr:hypothetical protein NEDG_00362 [Nematocida displodere]
MEDVRAHSRILQAVVVEILHQVGFEKANRQALQILIDITLDCISKSLIHLKSTLESCNEAKEEECVVKEAPGEPAGPASFSRIVQQILIEECAGVEGSYRREELISFLHFHNNATKQLKKEESSHKEESLLEILRVGDTIRISPEGDRALVDFTGEEETENSVTEDKKYLDKDVQEYLQQHPELVQRPKPPHTLLEEKRESRSLDQPMVRIYREKKEYLLRSHLRDYEYLLSKKRLSSMYTTPCSTLSHPPLLDDFIILSATRCPKSSAIKPDVAKEEVLGEGSE